MIQPRRVDPYPINKSALIVVRGRSAKVKLIETTGICPFCVGNIDMRNAPGFWRRKLHYQIGNPQRKLTKTGGSGLVQGTNRDYRSELRLARISALPAQSPSRRSACGRTLRIDLQQPHGR